MDGVEWPSPPRLSVEPLVLGQRLDAEIASRIGTGVRTIFKVSRPLAPGFLDELHLLVGREKQMRRPITVGLHERRWRESRRQASRGGVERAVEGEGPARLWPNGRLAW